MFVLFRLVGDLDPELTKIGLRSEMELSGQLDPKNKAIYFKHYYVIENDCVVWESNYQILVIKVADLSDTQKLFLGI